MRIDSFVFLQLREAARGFRETQPDVSTLISLGF